MCLAASRVVAQVPADLQKTMEERDQALTKADAATWDRLTADDFTLVDETGTFMTKAQRLAQIKTQKPTRQQLLSASRSSATATLMYAAR
jgi:hypothetical protein